MFTVKSNFAQKTGFRMLSPAQLSVWMAQMLDVQSPAFNIAEYIEILGPVDRELFERTLRQVVRETDALRLRVVESQTGPTQYFVRDLKWEMLFFDLGGEPNAEDSAHLWMREDRAKPFDPSRDSLFTYALFGLSPERFFWYARYHHLCLDGLSGALIARRVAAVYSALAAGHNPEPSGLGSFHTLLDREVEYQQSAEYAGDGRYWRERTGGLPERATLSRKPAAKSRSFVRSSEILLPPLINSLASLGKKHVASLSQIIAAATALYMHRLTGATDVVLGVPFVARIGRELRQVPGMTSNVLPLRLAIKPEESFSDLLKQAGRRMREALRHQRYPATDLRRGLGLSAEEPDIYGAVVNVMPFGYDLRFAGHFARAYNLSNGPVDELAVVVYDRQDNSDVRLDFDANPDHYKIEELSAHQRRFLRLLRQLVTNADLPSYRFELLSAEERRQLLNDFNTTARAIPQATLAQLFEAQAAQAPNAIALLLEDQSLSYADLNRQANRLAHCLIAHGVGPENLVGICLERSFQMAVSLLAIVKAGAAYLPLDPNYPQARLEYMTADAAPVMLLSSSHLRSRLPQNAKVLELDSPEVKSALLQSPVHDPQNSERVSVLLPQHPAYVIYTSGSSGQPKGVVVGHKGLASLAAFTAEKLEVGHTSRFLQFASLSFDASLWEMLTALSSGAALVLLHENQRGGATLGEVLTRQQVTHAHLQPAVLQTLEGEDDLPLKVLIVGSEACPGELVGRWSKDRWMVNAYGPTEATVVATMSGALAGSEAPPIGVPLWNTRVYVLDGSLEPVPEGVGGELYVGGLGLARGYMNRPGLTAERFVADPYGAEPGARVYRTGDLVRWRRDGALEFLGRADQQVKIRGFRIELGEIEAMLRGEPDVRQAAVTVRDDAFGDKQLAAYLVPISGAALDVEGVRRRLHERLPAYMVPAAFVVLDSLPLTSNGKLDRRALPAPETESRERRLPRTPEEELLCSLFAEVLGRKCVSIDDNFFHLGGHSLTAVRLAARVRSALGIELTIRELFESPTVIQLTSSLRRKARTAVPITPGVRHPHPPLSYGQRQLWFLYRMQGPSATYNVPLALRMEGEINAAALAKALGDVAARQETLRTIFLERDGSPFQQVLPVEDAQPVLIQEVVSKSDLAMRIETAIATGFNLNREIPLRAWLFQVEPQSHVLLLLLHHIACDPWSLRLLARDFGQAYAARIRGETTLPPAKLPIQYADYAMWQLETLGWEGDAASSVGRQLEFWRTVLAGAPEELNLPADRPRPSVPSYRGAIAPVRLQPELHRELLHLAHSCGASLFMVLHAGLAALLCRLGAGEDIPIGIPVSGRGEPATEELIGFFVNTLVMRTDVSKDPSFKELVTRVRAFSLEAYEKKDVPFQLLVEALHPERSLARHPLFQVMLVMQDGPEPTLELPGMKVQREPITENVAKFDLTLVLEEHLGDRGQPLGIEGGLEYSLDLFDSQTATMITECLVRLLEGAVARPNVPLHELSLLDSNQLHTLLDEFNVPPGPKPTGTVVDLFEAQTASTPYATALLSGDNRLSYTDLNAQANRLAHYLMGLGVETEDTVGICMERCPGMVVALVAALKTGAAFVPLEPDYPQARLSQMLADSGAAVVITQGKSGARVPRDIQVVRLDEAETRNRLRATPAHNPKTDLLPDHAAYVIYTSGTTGTPKGVVVSHGALANKISTLNEYLGINQDARFAAMTSLSFDPLLEEVLCPLSAGGAVVIIPDEIREDAQAFAKEVRRQEVTIVNGSPRLIESLLLKSGTSLYLNALLVGGDVFPVDLANGLNESGVAGRIVNFYGPTEICIDATAYELGKEMVSGSVPIGRPLPNYRIYVLDPNLEPAPTGVRGELYVAGAGLARGYLKQSGLTAERFVADPHGTEAGRRMYRTGDLARWRRDGVLEFLGRADQQVKIRGFRVELGEIEAALLEEKGIKQTAVVAKDVGVGGTRLVAYVVPDASKRFEMEGLRQRLSEKLPEYMVPAALIVLAELPLTSSGKLDHQALPAPEWEVRSRRCARPGAEQVLCRLIAELLSLEQAGVEDNFFHLGGDSILSIQLVSRARRAGWEITPQDVFQQQTVEGLAAVARVIVDDPQEPSTDKEKELVTLSEKERKLLEEAYGELEEVLPLSPLQEGLLFHSLYDQNTADIYTVQLSMEFEGRLESGRMRRAAEGLLRRHRNLRVSIVHEGLQHAVQVVPKTMELRWREEDLSGLEIEEAHRSYEELLTHERSERFKFARGPLLRFSWVRLGAERQRLVLTNHHVLLDGWSMPVLLEELLWLYQYGGEDGNGLPPVRPYVDYLKWLQRQNAQAGLRVWQEYLAGIEEGALVASIPASDGGEWKHWEKTLPREFSGQLRAAAQARELTLNTLVQGAWAVLLGLLSGRADVIFGVTVSGRPSDLNGVERMVGLFINTVPLRVQMKAGEAIWGLLRRIQESQSRLLGVQHVGLSEIQKEVGRGELFDTIVVFENYPLDRAALKEPMEGVRITGIEGHEETHYPLNLTVVDSEELRLELDLDGARVKEAAPDLGRWLLRLLEVVADGSDVPLEQLEILEEEERQRLQQKNRSKPSGKADQRSRLIGTAGHNYRAPRTAKEQALCQIFSEILALTRVGLDDNFFHLGGDSILSIQVVSRARQAGLAIKPRDIFERQTVEALAAVALERVDGPPTLIAGKEELVKLSSEERKRLETVYGELEQVLPLSPLQEGLLFHSLYDESAADIYTVQLNLEFEGLMDAARVKLAFESVLRRHPNLRVSIYHEGAGRALQVVPRKVELPWREVDLSPLGSKDRQARCQQLKSADLEKRFVLAAGPLLRMTWVRLGSRRQRLIFTNHHILMDGWSTPLFFGELLALYRSGGDASGLPPVRPYADYLRWLETQEAQARLRVWREYLAGVEDGTRLAQESGTTSGGAEWEHWERGLSQELSGQLRAAAQARGLTLNTVVQGAWAVVLGLVSEREDVIFGVTVSGRPAELSGVERMVGLFINTLPLRVQMKAGEGIWGLLRRIQESQSRLLGVQHVGLSEIQKEVGLGELFDTIVVFENYPLNRAALKEPLEGVRITGIEGHEETHYPLTLTVVDGEEVRLELDLDRGRVKEAGEDVGRWLVRLLEVIAEGKDVLLEQLEILEEEERQRLLQENQNRRAAVGKGDRHFLPASGAPANNYRPPQTAKEQALCQIFSEILAVTRVGLDDNFFHLGGDSILSIQVVSRARRAGLAIKPRDIFEQQTVKRLAAVARERVDEPQSSTKEDQELVKLSAEEKARLEDAYGELEEVLPLSPLQEGLLFHSLYDQSAADTYTVQLSLELEGVMDAVRMKSAFAAVLYRHANLRVSIDHQGPGRALQVVPGKVELPWREIDLSTLDAEAQQVRCEELQAADRAERFVLAAGPLLQMTWLHLGPQRQWLVFTNHHILMDGWSMPLFFGELLALYRNGGDASGLPPVHPYADYLRWLARQDSKAGLQVWREHLADVEEGTRLVQGGESGQMQQASEHRERGLSSELTAQLQTMARERGWTLNTVVQGLWAVLLARLTGRDDVVFGVTVSGRPAELAGVEQMIGLFINTLPLRVRMRVEEPLGEMLTRIQESQSRLLAVQHIGLSEIQKEVGRGELFDTILVFQNYPLDRAALHGLPPGIQLSDAQGWETTHYPLTLTVFPDEKLQLRLDFDPARVPAAEAQSVAARFERLLEAAVVTPDAPLHRFGILNAEERHTLLVEFNPTANPLPIRTITSLFEEQVKRTPSAMAVVFSGETSTYAELNRRANQLAHYLRERGIGLELPVAVCLERSLEMVVALLGILKAGGAYVPLDPTYPMERLDFMLQDSAVPVLLTNSAMRDRLPASWVQCIEMDADWDEIQHQPDENLHIEVEGRNAAYVIYTSGSTGQPKGVLVPHEAVVRLVCEPNYVKLDTECRILQLASLSFDAATFEIWGALLNGGSLIVMQPGPASAEEIAEVITEQGITTLWLTAGLFHEMADSSLSAFTNVRQLLAGGDVLSGTKVEQVRKAAPHCRVINGYGPTENTTFTTCYPVPENADVTAGVPIGFPINHTRVYVLDGNLELVPAGVKGELFAAGTGLARGYVNRPDLTAERFVADPLGAPGTRMYRTGDLVRWRTDGALEFLGRADHQVKVRGHRIELGEIEAALIRHSSVRQCAVIAREDHPDNKQLVAYMVAASEHALDSAGLREHLSKTLPDYMVPAAFVILNALPLTPNGKLDRRALPPPERAKQSSRPARTQQEQILCDIFAEVLSLEQVGVEGNFFYLGGDSILAIQLVSRARRAGLEITLRDVFQQPTLEALASGARIADEAPESAISSSEFASSLPREQRAHVEATYPGLVDILPLSPLQEGLLFHTLYDQSGPDVYAVQLVIEFEGAMDAGRMKLAFDAVLRRHPNLTASFYHEGAGRILQIVPGKVELPWREVDLSPLDAEAQQVRRQELQAADKEERFVLAAGPLLRMTWLRLGPQQQWLVFTVHHILMDGWSMPLFFGELLALYRKGGDAGGLPSVRPYADYLRWLAQQDGKAGLEAWKEYLAGVEEGTRVVEAAKASEIQRASEHRERELSSELTLSLQAMARERGLTVNTVMQGLWAILVGRLTGRDDVVFGVTVAGRPAELPGVDQMIGLFINTVPLRVQMQAEEPVEEMLSRIQESQSRLLAVQHVGLSAIQEAMRLGELFDTIMVFENYPLDSKALSNLLDDVRVTPVEVWDGAHYPLALAATLEERLHLRVDYDPHHLASELAETIVPRLVGLLEQALANPALPVYRLEVLNAGERRQLLEDFNATARAIPQATLAQLFEAQAAQTPNAPALLLDDQSLSYVDLNRQANRLAHLLIAHGVGPEKLVGICLERSFDMVASLLAIVKAGGAYLPLDPDYPQTRLEYMTTDAAPAMVLSTSHLRSRLPQSVKVLELDSSEVESALLQSPAHNPGDAERVAPLLLQHPAYVIYTSGSTGKPKGVVVEHKGLAALATSVAEKLAVGRGSRFLQFASLSFDTSLWEVLTALSRGAASVLLRENQRSGAALHEVLVRQQVTHALIPPAVLPTLEVEEDLPLEVLIVGGEACPGELVGRWSEGRRMVNAFGPTETTVMATISGPLAGSGIPPIGVPIWNTRVYVLDGHLEPVPQGLAGEMYVAGLGLARGYLKRPGLTAERFVADPYGAEPGTRMYRTGDLVRWRRDGALDFLGRVDQQVKIRGFRVELGEVEAALLTEEGIKQAVVTVRQEGTGSKRLVGHVIATEGATIDLESVRQKLRERLPEHMVPAALVLLDTMPITPSGKVDVRSLPAPETPAKKYRQPRTTKEQALCRILSELLAVERVGLDDNFFELGGDSILSIQLVGRARAMGLVLSPRDVFQQPSVGALAAVTKTNKVDVLSPQDIACGIGEIVATPIIRSFLEGQTSIRRFSQSVMLQVPAGVHEGDLLAAFQAVIDRHDVLRMQLESGGRLHVRNQGTVFAQDCFQRVPVPDENGLHAAVRNAEGRLDPEQGAMTQVTWFSNQQRLLWVIHHLAVDGVSWRILLPDLVAAWQAVVRGKKPALEPVDTSFRAWAAYLADRATTKEIEAEIPKWEKILLDGRSLLPGVILDPKLDTVSSAGHLSVSLSRSTTSALLTSMPAAFHARINDVLLTALALSVAHWQYRRGIDGNGSILIDLEGHGREPGESGLDLSRTVGWFTSLFPVALNVGSIDIEEALAGKASAGRALKLVKEQLRAIPGQGLGYGLLRHLHPEAGPPLADMPAAQIGFNYLGRFAVDAATDWSPVDSSDGVGGAADEEMSLFHLLEINAITTDGPQGPSLSATWDWATRHLSQSDVRDLAEGWKQALESLVRYCKEPGAGGHTPSDFSMVAVSLEQIEQIEARYPSLVDILPLSPLQEGLLFHALYDQSGPDVYTVQLVIEFEGAMDAARMKSAFATVLRRHPNLRVSIHHKGLGRALQVVPGIVELPWREVDLSALDAEGQRVRCQELQAADREERFVLAAGPLLRMTWLRLGPKRQRLVFTNHHILMDGWSMPLFFGELLALYRSGGDAGGLPPARPFADYLRWLAQQDSLTGLEVWKEYLAGVGEGTLVAEAAEAGEVQRASKHLEMELSSELTLNLQAMAREWGLTVNTVMQGLWAVLLGRLTGREDVVFGVTVSGRPPELPGVEQMIGLFINTLPLRLRMRAEEPLGKMLTRIQESQSRLLAVQHVGLSEIQEAVGCGLFDTIVVFENYPLDRASLNSQLPNVQMTPIEGWDEVHYPLALIVTLEEQMHFRLDCDPHRVAPEVAETVVPRLVRLLEQALANPSVPVGRLDVLNASERRQLLEEFNATARAIPQASLAELFEAHVWRSNAPAVVFKERSLSYAELDELANRLANHLVHQGVSPGSPVALRLDRSPELVIAMLAITKCGAAYVPLDLAYPHDRAEFMLADSGAELLLTSESLQHTADKFQTRTLTIDELLRIPAADSHFRSSHGPGQLAYVMYTSGSSGMPKGIAVPQSAVVRLVCNTDYVTLRPGDRVAQCSNTSFDAATFEIWGALLNGATLIILSSETMLSPGNLAATLKEQRVDTLFLTTALFNQIASDAPGALAGIRDLLFGGEAVDPSWVHQVLAGNAPYGLLHVYGPTENTTFSTWERVTNVPSQATTVPIGRPIANTTCYVLNSWLEPVSPLAVGELYLGGAGLAQSYWNRRALTAERFVANPYGPPGTRMYRTGDLARWNAEGKLEFVGRTDQQVKIRGFRIELGEIEAALREQPGIEHAAVIASGDGRGNKQLVAYVSVSNGNPPDEEHLRAGLRQRLPEFMVPAAFVVLDQLPLTPNGKLDFRALPAPDRQIHDYHPPSTPEEELLCAIFAELLSLKQVNVEDDFFSLGGHSLMAMRAVSRVRSALGIEISVRDVFAARTIRELGATIVALQFAGNGGHSSAVAVSNEFEEEEI